MPSGPTALLTSSEPKTLRTLDSFTRHDPLYTTADVSGGRGGGVELNSAGSDNLAVKKLARASTSGANLARDLPNPLISLVGFHHDRSLEQDFGLLRRERL